MTRALIARDQHGNRLCGPCVGFGTDFACRTCGTDCITVANGECGDCTAASLATTLLTNPDGIIAPQFRPLWQALTNPDTRAVSYRWLQTSSSLNIIAEFVATGQTITHEHLDEQPETRAIRHLRYLLTASGVLPERDELLARLEAWIDTQLTKQPPQLARIIGVYAHWTVAHRLRRQAERKPVTERSTWSAKRAITIAARFCEWLDERDIALHDLDQSHVDAWLDDGPSSTQYLIGPFLNSMQHRGQLSTKVNVPPRPRTPITPTQTDDRWRQLRICFTDESIDLDVRTAGMLVLLYAQTVTRLMTLPRSCLQHQHGDTYITLHRRPVLLPPTAAKLAWQQSETAPTSTWLFPGRSPGQAHSIHGMFRRLQRAGVTTLHGRIGALTDLVSELPSPVITDLLGIDIQTTTKWARRTSRDWNTYIRARRSEFA